MGLLVDVKEYVRGKPVVTCMVVGSDPELETVVFNAHVDVVPSGDSGRWESGPFDAEVSDDGFVVGRGTQDMKAR